MLVGRERECGRLDGLLDAAQTGRSGVLVLRGERGVGKTALLRHALEWAGRRGLQSVQARGIESESELAFAGLADLLRPIRHAIARIPEPQQTALAGALAMGPSVPGDRFAICAATLSVLAAAAEERPLLAVVDDIQWLDASSAEAVLFAARRLESVGIAVVIALREGEKAPLDVSPFPALRVAGLDEAPGIKLLDTTQSPVAAEVAARLSAAVGGNPLALLDIQALLSEAQRSGAKSSAFEVARMQLRHGEVLRRRRDRIGARVQLRAALQTFEQLGAEPWADRARAELNATAERARKRNVASSRDLTPQELQIALAVAGGATNREVAAQLFLSPKTVESHLSSLYRKLEIRSRTDLARLFAQRVARIARPAIGSIGSVLLALVTGLGDFQQQLQDGLLFGAWLAPVA